MEIGLSLKQIMIHKESIAVGIEVVKVESTDLYSTYRVQFV